MSRQVVLPAVPLGGGVCVAGIRGRDSRVGSGGFVAAPALGAGGWLNQRRRGLLKCKGWAALRVWLGAVALVGSGKSAAMSREVGASVVTLGGRVCDGRIRGQGRVSARVGFVASPALRGGGRLNQLGRYRLDRLDELAGSARQGGAASAPPGAPRVIPGVLGVPGQSVGQGRGPWLGIGVRVGSSRLGGRNSGIPSVLMRTSHRSPAW